MKHQKIVLCFLTMLGAIIMVNAQDQKTNPELEKSGVQATSVDSAKWKVIPKGTRQVTIVEDRAQNYMISKVYELKHVKGCDIRPWVDTAVRRADSGSNVQRLNYKAGGKQYLVVNMPSWLVDDIDDMIEKIDKPGAILGTGITHYAYSPKHRSNNDIMTVINDIFLTGETNYFLDTASNMIIGKNSASDAKDVDKFLRIMDRPVPQVEMRINMYEVNLNDLAELGIDYVKWKNGPGADILNIGADILNFDMKEEFIGRAFDLISKGSHSWAGFLVAPNFDASFIRLLAQKGKARVATSGVLTVTNSYTDPGENFPTAPADGSVGDYFALTFTPQYQNISKDGNQAITVANNNQNNYQFHLRRPVICFKPTEDNPEAERDAAVMTFGWVLSTGSVVERDNNGDEVVNTNLIRSYLTTSTGSEKLIASFKRHHDVNQNNAMPFLGEIPGLKYLFGSSADTEADYKVFVTVETLPLPPRADLSAWAGKIINTSDSLMAKKAIEAIEEEPEIQKPAKDVEEIK